MALLEEALHPSRAPQRPLRVVLVNPNTSQASTDMMVAVARRSAPDMTIEGVTAPFGSALITDEAKLSRAAEAVIAIVRVFDVTAVDGMIIAAFGDPALEDVRELVDCVVVGLAEASMLEAAEGGRAFAVATTTPDLARSIEQCAVHHGLASQFRGVRVTAGDPLELMGDRQALQAALAMAVHDAVAIDGAEAVIVGGGPLSEAALHLAASTGIAVIEPIPAALRLLSQRVHI